MVLVEARGRGSWFMVEARGQWLWLKPEAMSHDVSAVQAATAPTAYCMLALQCKQLPLLVKY